MENVAATFDVDGAIYDEGLVMLFNTLSVDSVARSLIVLRILQYQLAHWCSLFALTYASVHHKLVLNCCVGLPLSTAIAASALKHRAACPESNLMITSRLGSQPFGLCSRYHLEVETIRALTMKRMDLFLARDHDRHLHPEHFPLIVQLQRQALFFL